MTKNDIAHELCKRVPGLTKSTALHTVEGLTGILSDAFRNGENVYLRGFGTFEVKTAKEKKARNMNTGGTVVVPARRIVKFRSSNELKKTMNDGTVD